VLIGQKKALGIAVRNDRPQRRYSGLLTSLKGKRDTNGHCRGAQLDSMKTKETKDGIATIIGGVRKC
jgi:hypothetical protein